jgi:POT family proton-dependent oligopeptide transporter
MGVGFLLMVFAGRISATGVKVSMLWLVAQYFFATVGEFFVSPTGLSYVTRAAPARFVSLLIGVFFISNFLANVSGGYVAGYVGKIANGEAELFWYRWFRLGGQADFFFLFVVSSFGAGLLILLLTPVLKRLIPRDV